MRSIVISELFRALPARDVACLRFNFRGVEGSTGTHDEGRAEGADAVAAIDALVGAMPPRTPVVLAGWSFGGDVALSVARRPARGMAGHRAAAALRAARIRRRRPAPKHLVLAEHDEYRAPDEIIAATSAWRATTVEVVSGASHFFVGRTDAVVAAADGLIGRVER